MSRIVAASTGLHKRNHRTQPAGWIAGFLGAVIAASIVMSFIANSQNEQFDEDKITLASVEQISELPWKPAISRAVYAPAYSHIYHQRGNPTLLTVTLSIRNTDRKEEIVVTNVIYFDGQGRKIRSMLDRPIKIKALAATEFVISKDDNSGGSGASFIVEWAAGKIVDEPVIQTVMIDTSSGQGLSFLCEGRVLRNITEPSGSTDSATSPSTQ